MGTALTVIYIFGVIAFLLLGFGMSSKEKNIWATLWYWVGTIVASLFWFVIAIVWVVLFAIICIAETQDHKSIEE